jgi:hypothetical protein
MPDDECLNVFRLIGGSPAAAVSTTAKAGNGTGGI